MKHVQLTVELQEKASIYAAGAMPEGERLEYVRHLEEEDCPVCRQEVRELQAAASLMGLSLPERTPSPQLHARLMAQAESTARTVRTTEPATRRSRLSWAFGLLSAATIVLLALALQNNAQLMRLAHSLSARVSALESQIDQQRTLLATMTSPEVRVVNLAGQGSTPNAGGRIFWDRS